MASVMRIDHFGARTRPHRKVGAGRDAIPASDLTGFRHRADIDYARSLNRLIESEIIPRLLVAHSNGPHAPAIDPRGGAVVQEDVATFAPLTLHVEADELLEHVDRLIARGVSHESLLVDLLAPAARWLGQLWEEDRCDFVDVTMGLWRLQQVVHEISGRSPHGGQHEPAAARRALFASLEGDQHSFGSMVIDELFCANGWQTHRLTEASTPDLLEQVRAEWFDLAGLTITCDCHIAALPSIVRSLRVSSRNPRICVMVGGRVFINNAGLAASVGADGTAPDARIALGVASDLVDAVAREAVSPMSG